MKTWKIAILLFLILGSGTTSFSQKGELAWDDKKPLTWKDFKKRVGNGGYYKAYTYSGIRYTVDEEDRQIVIAVESYFVRDESWVFAESQEAYLLEHEQMHFDITELYARKMRKQFDQYQVHIDEFFAKIMMDEVKSVFNDLYNEMEATQKLFDKETEHSLVKEKQEEWKESIRSQLEELEEWAL
jgi:FtsZ-binding cell division protein ZapB